MNGTTLCLVYKINTKVDTTSEKFSARIHIQQLHQTLLFTQTMVNSELTNYSQMVFVYPSQISIRRVGIQPGK